MTDYGLSESIYQQIQSILRQHPEVEEVRIFGSRAMGNFQDNSDIDLALWGQISNKQLAAIKAKLDELPTPYKFDLKIYDEITHQPLTQHIDEHGKALYRKDLDDSCPTS